MQKTYIQLLMYRKNGKGKCLSKIESEIENIKNSLMKLIITYLQN